jgi:ATP-dependent Clp protease ATP-binding subunit ClpA
VTTGQIPFTPRAKRVLELSLREALSLGHDWIGTEHVLLGLVREGEGVAVTILGTFDADADRIRNEIIRMLSGASLDVRAQHVRDRPRRFSLRRHEMPSRVVGWLMFAAPLGVGILIGWAIRGH